jgi:hypothetical protein
MNKDPQQVCKNPQSNVLVVKVDPKQMEQTRKFIRDYREHKKRSSEARIQFD